MSTPGPDPAVPYGGPPPTGRPLPGYGYPPPGPGYGYPPPGPGYGYPPPGPGYGYPPPGPGYGYPPPPPGTVLIPGVPPLRAASPGQRALARLIDSAGYLLLVVAAVIGIVAIIANSVDTSVDYSYGYPSTSSSTDGLAILWIYPIVGGVWLIIVSYEWLTIGLTGATVGQRLMGVRFVNTRDGGPAGVGRSLGRAVTLGGSMLICYGVVFLLLLFSMFFDSQNGRYQGWVDKLCGLQAVTTRS